mmetsp:Transcript_3335/g.7823  ORF Transcript_3335/g.7823 Transcript_3335/m.7823 type:complete len:283 (-) Transcript_3335:71-919(-)
MLSLAAMMSSERLITGYKDWDWERDAVGFYNKYSLFLALAAALYYPVIFGIQYYLKDRKGFDLGGAKSVASINWIFWWEVALAVFSIWSALHVVPMMLAPLLEGRSWEEAICEHRTHQDPRAFYMFLFTVSKVPEFGDTLFVVLRKRPLILLQHYHHLTTMLYSWYSTVRVWRYNNVNAFFSGMNLVVHSVMYSWYAATRTGWRSPKPLMMLVTVLQLLQMIGGVFAIYISIYGNHPACGKWIEEEPYGVYACTFMYTSYLILFGKLFVENYIFKKKKMKNL